MTTCIEQETTMTDQVNGYSSLQSTDRLGDCTLVSLQIESTNSKPVETNDQKIEAQTKTTETNKATDLKTENSIPTTDALPENSRALEVTVRAPGDSDWRLGQSFIVEVEQNRLMWFDLSSGNNLDRENS
jgi:hypothetical protein